MTSTDKNERLPAVAGIFYPADPEVLRQEVTGLIKNAGDSYSGRRIQALLSPHAGYIFSGPIAATAFSGIKKGAKYDNVFVIASGHRHSFYGASVYSGHKYVMPGEIFELNHKIAATLSDGNSIIAMDDEPHYEEHSVEVQLPFISDRIASGFRLVPLIIGRVDNEGCREIALRLKPFFNENNLFVFSSDFSHYPDYQNAKVADERTKVEFLKKDPDRFYDYIHSMTRENIPGLVTPMCGWTAGMVYLHLIEGNNDVNIIHRGYSNSGDSDNGHLNRVVGYHAFVSEILV